MVNVSEVPVHVIPAFVKLGVTVIVAVTAALDKFVAGKDVIALVPVAGKLIDVVLLVQVYTEFAFEPPKVINGTEALLHTTRSVGSATLGVGFTVIKNDCGVPLHVIFWLVNEGVT